MMYEGDATTASRGPLLSIEDYLAVVRRRKWLVLGFALAGLFIGLVLALQRTDVYRATATVLVNPTPVASPNNNLLAPNLDREVEVLLSDPLRQLAREKLSPESADLTDSELASGLDVSFADGSDVIRIAFDANDPSQAAEVANAFAAAYIDRRLGDQVQFYDDQLIPLGEKIAALQVRMNELTAQLADLEAQRADVNIRLANNNAERNAQLDTINSLSRVATTEQAGVAADLRDLERQQTTLETAFLAQAPAGEVLSTASIPGSPTGLGTIPIALAGLFLGLIAGVSAASLAQRLDSSASDPGAVTQTLGTQVLGTIPAHLGWRRRQDPDSLVMRSTQSSARSHVARESFRRLRTAVEYLMRVDGIKSLLITSTKPGEGKSLTAANLAVALASRGVRVALINADMRRPTLETWFGHPNSSSGLAGYLGGLADDFDPILFDDIPGLALIPAGLEPANPGDLLASDRFTNLLKSLHDQVDLVIVDTPPIGAAADAAAAAAAVDGVLIMVDATATSIEELRVTRADLERSGATIVGAILNRYRGSESYRGGRKAHYYSSPSN